MSTKVANSRDRMHTTSIYFTQPEQFKLKTFQFSNHYAVHYHYRTRIQVQWNLPSCFVHNNVFLKNDLKLKIVKRKFERNYLYIGTDMCLCALLYLKSYLLLHTFAFTYSPTLQSLPALVFFPHFLIPLSDFDFTVFEPNFTHWGDQKGYWKLKQFYL